MKTHKPSRAEDEYIAREEAEKKRKLALTQTEAMAAAERERLRALHHMHCPKCGMGLQQISLESVQASRCFSCHGLFLAEADVHKLLGQQGYWSRLLGFFASRDYRAPPEPEG